jgi:tagaturonate reductase
MQQLSKEILNDSYLNIEIIPKKWAQNLPVKIIQFGTGALLRGLPDYFIDKANQQNVFNGSIVAVKSTLQGDASPFEKQDCLYTICVNGIEHGKIIQETHINSSIKKVISANTDWDKILKYAEDPGVEIVISNTTEIGIAFVPDNIHATPPQSFTGKLLSFLYRRYQFFNGDSSKGMVIIPTELIPDNAVQLLSILSKLSSHNKLEESFIKWLSFSNHFCNSLVDRIVPGKLPADKQIETEDILGYKDDLLITAEPYRLWAIETQSDKVRNILSFSSCDEGLVLSPDISNYRELKLRLLNGTHTFCCGLAHLAGFNTVKSAMKNDIFSSFINRLMKEEIAPAITNNNITTEAANSFSEKVIDRLKNPFIEHRWLNICENYTLKMKTRNIVTIEKYFEKFNSIPECMALGLAAYILFMKADKKNSSYYGMINASAYEVKDSCADVLSKKWADSLASGNIIKLVLSDISLWGIDLLRYDKFENVVRDKLYELEQTGVLLSMSRILSYKINKH